MTKAAEELKEMRAELDLSQSGFAKKFGIPCRTIQKWEAGQASPKPYLLQMMRQIIAEEKGSEKI